MTTKESDRELLTLAAKAAGIELFGWRDHWADFGPGYQYEDSNGIRDAWNPLTQDDDAFRLAVRLGMETYVGNEDGHPVQWVGYSTPSNAKIRFICELHGKDACDAARRCIVRAAAAIGKEK